MVCDDALGRGPTLYLYPGKFDANVPLLALRGHQVFLILALVRKFIIGKVY